MIRSQIILDDETYHTIRQMAFQKHYSLSKMVRALLHEKLHISSLERPSQKFSFIGLGKSKSKSRVSEDHDTYLGESSW